MTPNIHPNNSANIASDAQSRFTPSRSGGAGDTQSGKSGAFGQILDKAQQQSPKKQGSESGPDATIAANIANEPEMLPGAAAKDGKLPPAWFTARMADEASRGQKADEAKADSAEGKDGADGQTADSQSADGNPPSQNALMMALHAAGTGKAAAAGPGSSAGTGDGAKALASPHAATGMGDLAAQKESGNSAAAKATGQPEPTSRQDSARIFPLQSTVATTDAALPQAGTALADASPEAHPGSVKGAPSAKSDEQPLRPLPIGSHAAAERVSVVSTQSIPTPVPHQIGQTALGLVGSIAGNTSWQAMLPTAGAGAFSTPSYAAPAHMLRIELHPAELGMVQVGLRLAGGQLSIEITPQTHEAWRHLASDTDAIARSMRDLGFDVGKITLLQPAIAAAPPARTDAGGGLASAGRDQSFQQQGQAGSGGSNGQQSGTNHGQEQGQSRHGWAPERGTSGRGLFI